MFNRKGGELKMNKKVVMSLLSIISALALLGGAAYAQFVVTATSNSSTFASGNPALELCNDAGAGVTPTSCGTQIPSPINVTDLIPGVPQTFYFWLDNTGTDTLTPLTMAFSSPSNTGAASVTGTNSLEDNLSVTVSCDTTSNAAAGPATFSTWETTQTLGAGSLATLAESRCGMTVELPAGNSASVSQVLNFNATFSGSDGS